MLHATARECAAHIRIVVQSECSAYWCLAHDSDPRPASQVPWGKVEEYARLGAELLPGWAINEDGQPAKDPEAVLRSGALMNLGGSREQSGHKGYCLAAMVDILCSVNIKRNAAHTSAVRPSGVGGGRCTRLCFRCSPAEIGGRTPASSPPTT
jgi:hypothetical protein